MTDQDKRRELIERIIRRLNEHISIIESQKSEIITVDEINSVISKEIETLAIDFLPEEINEIRFKLQQRTMQVAPQNKSALLQSGRIKRWLSNKTPSWSKWKGYEDMLLNKSLSSQVISDNEEVIDNCIDMAGDPNREGPWECRGLVMGNVQMGKTLNFIGLINKAMDAGYHTIIVIGGHLKELREQTQERIDEGVVGKDSKALGGARANVITLGEEPFGVGAFGDGMLGRPHAMTTYNSDFSAIKMRSEGHNFTSSDPVIFVVKKNYKLLENLRNWIEEFSKNHKSVLDRPVLLIDDEADYASINTKKVGKAAAATNREIKNLLRIFNKKTYVGYTATPFANVFIREYTGQEDMVDDDLFPRDFMISMPIPDKYCGQDYFFPIENSSEHKNPVRNIPKRDYLGWIGLKHKKDVAVNGIPDSLKKAINCFLIVIAIRYLRGQKTEHNTMLVNVSRFNLVQKNVFFEIDSYLDNVRRAVKSSGAFEINKALENGLVKSLQESFESEYHECGFDFERILKQLYAVCKKVKLSLVNGLFEEMSGRGKSPLPYSDHKSEGYWVIAVGGLKLSRGLTLEGLSISYFLRNAAAYDTLTQMCRWFGYRPGYHDLCRLWITEESRDHYGTVATAIRQLYDDLKIMKAADATPKDFGMRVRSDDVSLLVTARNKMGTANRVTLNYNLWGKTFKKLRSHSSSEINSKNYNVIGNIISKISNFENIKNYDSGKNYLFKTVSYDSLIEIIKTTNYPMINPGSDTKPVLKALRAMKEKGLQAPDIVVFNIGKSSHPSQRKLNKKDRELASEKHDFFGLNLGLPNRSMKTRNKQIYSENSQIGDLSELEILFNKDELNAIKSEFENQGIEISYSSYQSKLVAPVMVIYIFAGLLIDEDDPESVSLAHSSHPTVNYSLYFPTKGAIQKDFFDGDSFYIHEMEAQESYLVNDVFRGAFEDDEDEDADSIL